MIALIKLSPKLNYTEQDYVINEKIFEQGTTIVYRITRVRDAKKFILKTLSDKYPALKNITALEQEYKLIKKIDSPNVIKALDLFKFYDKPALLLEDINGITLKRYLATHQLSLDNFFQIALQLIQAVKKIQTHHIIHKDINPHNIIIEEKSLALKVIDFNIAIESLFDTQELTSPIRLEGTLAYISPEQTGRINRIVDYRSDFYSLGATFYEMLTSQPPFLSDDPLELVYFHITQYPAPISKFNQQVPIILNHIN
jgi:histidine kinase